MSVVTLEWDGPVAQITINRPDQLNALNINVLETLDTILDEVAANPACRAAVLTGAGQKAFVAGADIKEMEALSASEAQAFSKKGSDLFLKLERMSVPFIAAVGGFALGGGCELAMACDMRIATEDAVFGMPETSLGIFPGFGGTQRLTRIVGYARAAELIFTCKKIKADQALDMGLVNQVVSKDNLLDEALAMAKTISKQAPIAVSSVKAVMQQGLELAPEARFELEAQAFGKLFDTNDTKGGLGAFSRKERYNYEGN